MIYSIKTKTKETYESVNIRYNLGVQRESNKKNIS